MNRMFTLRTIAEKFPEIIMLTNRLKSTLAVALIGMSSSLLAAPITVQDNYFGADALSYGDVVGADSDFDIESMEVDQNGSDFVFKINTAFAGKSGTLFNGLTAGSTGIGYGDLFLSNQWSPIGSAPYSKDDASNGTNWTYGLMLTDRYNDVGGDVFLYELPGSNLDDAFISDNLMTGGIWREGQEVTIKTDGKTGFNVGSWSSTSSALTISADLGQSTLVNGEKLAFHWGMTCANDVIEGEVDINKVPEPGTIGLAALALTGMFFMRRRSSKS